MKEKYETTKNGSLMRELVFIIVALVAGTILLCYFLNTTFIGKYYVLNKQKALQEGFQIMDEASADGMLTSSKFDVTFDNLCANKNITIMIINSDTSIVRSSANDNKVILMEFMNILFGANGRSDILAEKDRYTILRQNDVRLNSEYLVLYGTLQNGNLILMRSALESIRESAAISNQFLAIAGVLAVIISSIITFFVSRSITTPIRELSAISEKMTQLDFEAKFSRKRKRKNEIDELGEHVNHLSDTLEQTISELKSVNLALQKDIEKKTQIDEMRKEFLANVSHELKTPLAVISGYAEGLAECVNDDAESRYYYCEVILDEAEKMNQMVKQLLSLNQLEFGQETLQMQRFDLTELIQGTLQQVAILVEQNGITIDFSGKEPMYVWGDEFKIEEVIMNYLSNAIHYAKNEKQIRIFYTVKDACVRIHVFNTGDPIPEQALEQVWTKFYKVDKARTREYGGSGIGLSIVKAIMQSHNQKFGVENQSNGVEFWFELDHSQGGEA